MEYGDDDIELMGFKGSAYKFRKYCEDNGLIYFEKDVDLKEELPFSKVFTD
tara:strand:- start:1051 stop:1203 length:153 start_codon:yes stop_codon:yes gene_type:complete